MLGLDVSFSGETAQSGIIVSINPKNKKAFESSMKGTTFKHIGTVSLSSTIVIQTDTDTIKLPVEEALQAYRSTFKDY